jgi:hypothetical protein
MTRAAFVVAILVAGCGTRAPVTSGDLGPLDAAHTDRPGLETMPWWPDAPWLPDRGPSLDKLLPVGDSGTCAVCQPGEVLLISRCVSTDKLFTCASPCASVPCLGPGAKCDPWGGTPCCYCAAAVPACVPVATTGLMIGPLRISPVDGPAGQKVTLTISGAPFYIGALWYSVRMGNETVMWSGGGGDECSLSATFTPPKPGIYPVEVSQYGGKDPWVLAGFYTASGGVAPMPSIQPGYWCSMYPQPGDPPCQAAPPWACGCFSGRCRCK